MGEGKGVIGRTITFSLSKGMVTLIGKKGEGGEMIMSGVPEEHSRWSPGGTDKMSALHHTEAEVQRYLPTGKRPTSMEADVGESS